MLLCRHVNVCMCTYVCMVILFQMYGHVFVFQVSVYEVEDLDFNVYQCVCMYVCVCVPVCLCVCVCVCVPMCCCFHVWL